MLRKAYRGTTGRRPSGAHKNVYSVRNTNMRWKGGPSVDDFYTHARQCASTCSRDERYMKTDAREARRVQLQLFGTTQ